jgi:carbonic anhydrase
MTHLTNDGIRKNLKEAGLGDEKLDTYEFGEIREYVCSMNPLFNHPLIDGSLEQSVKDDVAFLKSSPYIPNTVSVHGYVFDLLKTGSLTKV